MAQSHPADAGGHLVDFTAVIVALINQLFAIVAAVATYLINERIKNQQLATMLSHAVQNGVGIIQQKAAAQVRADGAQGTFSVAVGSELMQAGVQYVLNNADEAIRHFNIDPGSDYIAQKISARLGLASIATNLAATASPAPVVAGPLAAVAMTQVTSTV
jgi:hypothetical protein